jgi:hypothetical protein
MPQCRCKTNDGSRCKHNANPNSSHHYCTQHDKYDKMRCVSLARKSIGYRSPKHRPTSPRASPRSYRMNGVNVNIPPISVNAEQHMREPGARPTPSAPRLRSMDPGQLNSPQWGPGQPNTPLRRAGSMDPGLPISPYWGPGQSNTPLRRVRSLEPGQLKSPYYGPGKPNTPQWDFPINNSPVNRSSSPVNRSSAPAANRSRSPANRSQARK